MDSKGKDDSKSHQTVYILCLSNIRLLRNKSGQKLIKLDKLFLKPSTKSTYLLREEVETKAGYTTEINRPGIVHLFRDNQKFLKVTSIP